MSQEFLDDELRALLSGYATGTLTPEERKLLFQKALAHQEIFDQLMEEETARAALEHPLAKRALEQALEEAEDAPELAAKAAALAARAPIPLARKRNWYPWLALAACAVLGVFGLWTYWQPRPALVEMAKAPVEAPTRPMEKPLGTAPPKAQAPVSPAPRPAASGDAKSEEAMPRLAPSPAPAASPFTDAAPRAEFEEKAKRESGEAVGNVAAPPVSPRVTARSAKALSASTPVSAPFELRGRRLVLAAAAKGYLYVFLQTEAGTEKVAGLAPLRLLEGVGRSVSIPGESKGLLRVVLLPQADDELDALPDRLPPSTLLPLRNWTLLNLAQ